MNDRLVVLDAQRGLCALFVALLHAKGTSHISASPFIEGSWLFVDFFFVLSGFVIALVYLDRIDGATSFTAFVMRRFGRLWPLHAFVLLLYILSECLKLIGHGAGAAVHTLPFSGTMSADRLGANLLMIHSLGLYETNSWNAPSWSISVEFYTYIVFAVLCVGLRRRIAAASLILVVVSIPLLSLWSSEHLGASLHFGIFRCWFGFFLGVLTLLAYRATHATRRRLPAPTVLEAVSVLATIILVIAARDGGALTMIAPFAFAAVVFIFAFEGGSLSRLLSLRPFTWLGDRSYALYMIHAFVGDLIVRVLLFVAAVLPVQLLIVASGASASGFIVSFANPYTADLAVLLYAGAALVAADIVHRTVERPGRALFNRLAAAYQKRRTPVLVATT